MIQFSSTNKTNHKRAKICTSHYESADEVSATIAKPSPIQPSTDDATQVEDSNDSVVESTPSPKRSRANSMISYSAHRSSTTTSSTTTQGRRRKRLTYDDLCTYSTTQITDLSTVASLGETLTESYMKSTYTHCMTHVTFLHLAYFHLSRHEMETGIYLLQQSSLLGSAKATHELAWIHLTHDKYRDEQKAVELLEKNSTYLESLHVLSVHYLNKKNTARAKEILVKLCHMHHFQSMLLLGMILIVEDNTAAEGFSWIKKCADSGSSVEALRQLAFLYAQGRGTEMNDTAALECFEKAGARGDAMSHYMSAHMLMHGRGDASASDSQLRSDPNLRALQHLKQAITLGLDNDIRDDAAVMVEHLSKHVRGETMIGSM